MASVCSEAPDCHAIADPAGNEQYEMPIHSARCESEASACSAVSREEALPPYFRSVPLSLSACHRRPIMPPISPHAARRTSITPADSLPRTAPQIRRIGREIEAYMDAWVGRDERAALGQPLWLAAGLLFNVADRMDTLGIRDVNPHYCTEIKRMLNDELHSRRVDRGIPENERYPSDGELEQVRTWVSRCRKALPFPVHSGWSGAERSRLHGSSIGH